MAIPTVPGAQAELKMQVREFWNDASCGEVYAEGASARERLDAQARARYALEPYIPSFARFADGSGRDVLEIGVGMGADHLEWAKVRPRSLAGVDLTPRAIDHTRARLACYGLSSDLRVADAENLPFADGTFDIVYAWGVVHHTPDTPRAIREVWRVLRPGGAARVMIYHTYSVVGLMLWLRYGLLAGRPRRSLADIFGSHLESPGTKAYTVGEASRMFGQFSRVDARSRLSFGDLLEGEVGQRHSGALLSVARLVWPRWLLKRVAGRFGLMLLVDAVK